MGTHAILGQPLQLGPLTASNRIVMPPLVIWKADESGEVRDAHVEHYARCAGPGLTIVEATTVRPEGRLAADQLGVWDDRHIAGLTRLATTIKAGGSLAGIQIHHAGGSTTIDRTYGLAPRVPTLLERSPEAARELSDSEIEEIVGAFAAGTRRALEAGFDVIELHGAHAYLISQFLSPETNQRREPWGGSAEARRRFLVDVIEAARAEIDAAGRVGSAALTVRLGVAAGPPRSLSIDEGLAAAEAAVAAGVDFLDVSNGGGIDEPLAAEIRERAGVEGRFEPTLLLAALVRRAVNVPVIGVNGIVTPEDAVAALEAGVADGVAVGRGILADPQWARKALGLEHRPLEKCRQCTPRCFWFKDPPRCPARKRLAIRNEQAPVT